MSSNPESRLSDRRAIVIGGGPAGLMAAEVLSAGGVQVDLYDAMPSVGRKFLLAGKGGMNITHSEPSTHSPAATASARRGRTLAGRLHAAAGARLDPRLGIDTFIGSSGRVFPTDMKAAPLLRAWLHRLREQRRALPHAAPLAGLARRPLLFSTPDGERLESADAVVLALGGASWARLGSDGAWVPLLAERGVAGGAAGADELRLRRRLERAFQQPPRRRAAHHGGLAVDDVDGRRIWRKGQFVVTATGIEGSLVYALSAQIRDRILRDGQATVWIDLLPDHDAQRVLGSDAPARRALDVQPPAKPARDQGREIGPAARMPEQGRVCGPGQAGAGDQGLAGDAAAAAPDRRGDQQRRRGAFEAVDGPAGMLRALPGVFVAGEMVDWEAPTGGYLLTACFGSGRAAGQGALDWLKAPVVRAPDQSWKLTLPLPLRLTARWSGLP
jgi:predicted flavoprotein YhiN